MAEPKVCPRCGKPAVFEATVYVPSTKGRLRNREQLSATVRIRCEECGAATPEVTCAGMRLTVDDRKDQSCYAFLQ